jgi:hypothetical protein
MRYARVLLLAAICGQLLSSPLIAQPSDSVDAEAERALTGIRPQALRAHMRFLSDDLLEGRRTATRGYDLAAKYVAAGFEALGLEPAGEPAGSGGGYFQPVPLLRTTNVESEWAMTLLRGGQRSELRFGVDYLGRPLAETEASVTAPVVFAGFGVTAPELGHDDYAGLDVRGKIVAILVGGPPTFPSEQRAYYAESLNQFNTAVAHGAVGLVALLTPEMERVVHWESMIRESKAAGYTWRDSAGRPRDLPPQMRAGILLSRAGAEALFAGAPHGLDQILEAAPSGRVPTFALPLEISLRTVSRREQAESPNVAALLRGSDPRLRDEVIVLSAHLDHLGVGEPVAGDAIYNGAYDNASGIAILLEVADALARLPVAPRRSVLFLAVTGEEQGLHGSDYFARHPTVPVERIVANINLDMVLMLHPLRDVIAFGAEHSNLGTVVEQAARRLGLAVTPDPVPEQAVFVRSDHYSFVKQGIPAIYLATGLETGDAAVSGPELWGRWMQTTYHQPGDAMNQTIDFEAGAQFARLNLLITYLIAQQDQAPAWNPGDFFGEKFGRKASNL